MGHYTDSSPPWRCFQREDGLKTIWIAVKIRKVHMVVSMELHRVNSNFCVGNRDRDAEEQQPL